MNTITPAVFYNECKKMLGFLVEDHKFSDPTLDGTDTSNIYHVTFYKNKIAIECSYDVRDQGDSFYVVKLIDGKKPDTFDINGEVVREHLTALLIARGIRDIKFVKELPESPNTPKQILCLRKSLAGHARLLKLYGQDILSGSDNIFNANRKN